MFEAARSGNVSVLSFLLKFTSADPIPALPVMPDGKGVLHFCAEYAERAETNTPDTRFLPLLLVLQVYARMEDAPDVHAFRTSFNIDISGYPCEDFVPRRLLQCLSRYFDKRNLVCPRILLTSSGSFEGLRMENALLDLSPLKPKNACAIRLKLIACLPLVLVAAGLGFPLSCFFWVLSCALFLQAPLVGSNGKQAILACVCAHVLQSRPW